MSSRATIAIGESDERQGAKREVIHAYDELVDDSVHLEVEVDGATFNVKIHPTTWAAFERDVRDRIGP